MTFIDYLDVHSHALLIFIMGCDNQCEGCQNPEFSSYDYRDNTKKFTVKELQTKIKKECVRHKTNKVVLSGGDPLAYGNWESTKELLDLNKEDIHYMLYTGHSVEYVKRLGIKGFTFIKCGKYDLHFKQASEKTDSYFKLASRNQGFYDESFKLLSVNGTYYFERD